MAPKDLKMHKWRTSDACTGLPPPTKKVKCTDAVRRSHCTGKGSGGAAEQLQRIGNVITTVQTRKTRDGFKEAGEALNTMAPETPTTKRVKKVRAQNLGCCVYLLPTFKRRRPFQSMAMDQSAMYFFVVDMRAYLQLLFRQVSNPSSKVVTKSSKGAKTGSDLKLLVSFIPLKVTLSFDCLQLLSTVPPRNQQSPESDPRPNTAAFGRKLIMEEQKRQQQKKMAPQKRQISPDDGRLDYEDDEDEDKVSDVEEDEECDEDDEKDDEDEDEEHDKDEEDEEHDKDEEDEERDRDEEDGEHDKDEGIDGEGHGEDETLGMRHDSVSVFPLDFR